MKQKQCRNLEWAKNNKELLFFLLLLIKISEYLKISSNRTKPKMKDDMLKSRNVA